MTYWVLHSKRETVIGSILEIYHKFDPSQNGILSRSTFEAWLRYVAFNLRLFVRESSLTTVADVFQVCERDAVLRAKLDKWDQKKRSNKGSQLMEKIIDLCF